MKDSIKKKPIQIICILLFALIVFSSLEKQDANTFREVQPESFIRSPIDQVIVFNERLYVCYGDSELVNVYDMNGVFLWCIDAPSMRNCHFEILDGMLVVYNYRTSSAYTYDAVTGEHLRIVAASSLDLSYNKTITHTSVEDLAPGEIGWDDFNVYRMEDDGPVKLVSRPWWYYLTHPILTWAVSFFSGLAIFIIQLITKFRQEKDTDSEELPPNVRKKAAFFKVYFFICGANATLNLLIIPFYPIYILASFLLAAVLIAWILADTIHHFIIHRGFVLIVEEHPYIDKWSHAGFAALLISIFSAVVMLMLTN